MVDQSLSEALCYELLQINAIKLRPQNPFTWASGIQSPIYCDNRIALSYPATRNLIIKGLDQLSRNFGHYETIAGVATAGIAHGALLANAQEKPFIYVRSKPKGHGRQNQIEGYLPEKSTVILVEDLISTGGSCIKAAKALESCSAEVRGVLAIFSYGFDSAKNNFEEAKLPYGTITDYETLLNIAAKEKFISTEDIQYLSEWRLNPEGWNPLISG